MIKSSLGIVEISGPEPIVVADLCSILRAYRNALKKRGKSDIDIEQSILEITMDSTKTYEEIESEIEFRTKDIPADFSEILDSAIKGMIEKEKKSHEKEN